jgi:hypothetical protein
MKEIGEENREKEESFIVKTNSNSNGCSHMV